MKSFFRRYGMSLVFVAAILGSSVLAGHAGAQSVQPADPQHAPFKLPAGMHPNSIGAQSFRAQYDAEEGIGCIIHKGCIPAVGRSADGKYPIYQLEGDIDDLRYISTRTNTVFQPQDLLRRMVFLAEADAKSGVYKCDFTCQDAKGRTVGLNPQIKWMLNPPAGKQAKKK